VLPVDTSQAKRELRAEVMRKLGVDVDCAADNAEARSWWRAALYDLVLINMEKGRGHRDRFCDDIRRATPPQRLAFLVGQPQNLADSPNQDEESPVQNADDQIVSDLKVAFTVDRGDLTQHWVFCKLHGESPLSVPRPSLVPKRPRPARSAARF